MSTQFTDLMRTGQEQFLETVRQSQKAVVDAVGAWAKAVERTPAPPNGAKGDMPSADAVVDNVFDFAEQMLAAQREFARNLIKATQPAVQRTQANAHAATKSAGKAAS